MQSARPFSDTQSSLPPLSVSPTLTWSGCELAAGVPMGRLTFGFVACALPLVLVGAWSYGRDEGHVPSLAVMLMLAGCAVAGLLTLFMRTRRVCRVTPNSDGLQVLWRVADNGFSRPRFVTDRPAWSEVQRLEKVHAADDGESGERWSVLVETRHPLQAGRNTLELAFPDELHLDTWLAEAQRRRARHCDAQPLL